MFAEEGYADTTMDAVARAAGISAAALYRYFPGKRDLYLATLRSAGPRLRELWREQAPSASDPLEAIRTMGLAYYEHLEGRSAYARLWFRALADASDPDVRDAIVANFTGMVDTVEGLIARAQEAGKAGAGVDARTAAWHFMAIGFTFDLLHLLSLDAELDRSKVEAWGELFIAGPRAEGQAMIQRNRGEEPLRGDEDASEPATDP